MPPAVWRSQKAETPPHLVDGETLITLEQLKDAILACYRALHQRPVLEWEKDAWARLVKDGEDEYDNLAKAVPGYADNKYRE